jgi:hypothetical protein
MRTGEDWDARQECIETDSEALLARDEGVIGIVAALWLTTATSAQVKEYDFYPEFRRWWFALPADQRQSTDAVIERYRTASATNVRGPRDCASHRPHPYGSPEKPVG